MSSSNRQLLEQAKLDNAQIGFRTIFNDALRVGPEPIMDLAMRMPSDTAQEEFPFLGDVPQLQEWVDDRPFSKLRVEKIVIRNRNYATGIRVDRDDIMDDKLNLVLPKILTLSKRARQHVAKSIVELLLNGFNGTNFPDISDGLSYDGQFYFSTTHQDGQGPVQSNFQTTGLSDASYEVARVAMQSLQDEEGEPLEILPQTLIVGPSNEKTALQIVEAGLIDQGGASGIENVFKGTALVVVSQRLVGSFASHWFLADLTQPVRPLIWLDREAPTLVAQNRLDDEEAFMRNKFRWGTQYRGGYGYSLWQFARGSDGTT